jgi:hypothetical protein
VVSEPTAMCRHCGNAPACLRSRAAPMLCFRCHSKPRLYAQYALPPDRVIVLLEAAMDEMVLEAIRRGRAGAEPPPVEWSKPAR